MKGKSMSYRLEPFFERVEKPWGFELLLTSKNYPRTGKILHINAGKRISFQYHDEKEEVMVLISGKALLWLEDNNGEIQKIPMELKKGYLITPPQRHRIEAVEDCEVFEVSTPETGTTFRLEDDFARQHETEEMRERENRGWKGGTSNE